jgi:hypothetical protein
VGRELQVLRVLTSLAMSMKYSSHDGRILIILSIFLTSGSQAPAWEPSLKQSSCFAIENQVEVIPPCAS